MAHLAVSIGFKNVSPIGAVQPASYRDNPPLPPLLHIIPGSANQTDSIAGLRGLSMGVGYRSRGGPEC